MWTRSEKQEYISKRWNNKMFRRVDVFACDQCSGIFTKGFKSAHSTNSALTFCSKKCNKISRSTGALAKKWKKTKLEKYGVEFSSQVDGASKKMIASRIERTGAAGPSDKNSISNDKFKTTMLERYGSESPLQADVCKEKFAKTFQERHGTSNPFNNDSPFRKREYLVKGGQVGYRATARKKNGWILSKPELMLVNWLKQRYGENDVEQQKKVDHGIRKPWLVDVYVKSIDTYVELDGVFWHGLDNPYEQLHESGKKAFDRDRKQDIWFKENQMKLVRITDKEFLASHKNKDFSDIVAKLGG